MRTRDALPDPLRHAIEQTLAAERLEGWRPTDEHVDALVALVCDETSFGDYFAVYRARYPVSGTPERREQRHVFRRRRPYLIPGTTVLRNNFGIDSFEALAELEFVATAARITAWHCRLAHGAVDIRDLDVRAIHQHVFGDVYPWAGVYRVTELRRGDSVFAWQSSVARSMVHVHESARAIANHGARLDAPALAYRLARLYAEYNHIHPFREGNGRTGTLLLHTVAALLGRRLDLSDVSREQWYAASHDSMPFRRDGMPNHRPFLPLFVGALG
ncbi:Fic family protein [Mycobacterium sp.]|uniref:Fic family protein n=1 Tax=Mycobacterium sp. TaxID=1785 RepID=UPI002D825ED2|nr:Fic family protein [Mycobacterium sp.]